jgi:GAF domain-containing protein
MKESEYPVDWISILIVDDEKSLLEPLQSYLEDFGYQVDTALNGLEAYALIEKKMQGYDVVLLDQTVHPGPSGLEIMKHIKNHHPDTECIILTARGNEHRQQALREGAFHYLEKPFDKEELALLIRTAAQQVRLRLLSRSMISNHKGEDLLQNIIASARSLAFGDDASIVLLEKGTNRFKIHRSTLISDRRWERHARNRSLSKEIIHSGNTISIPDVLEHEDVYQDLIDSGYRSFVGIPIPGESENLGVLYVYSKNPHQFDSYGSTAILRTMASQAGLAIVNTLANEQLALHNQYMEALVSVSRGLSATNKLEEQLSITWEFVRRQLGVSTFFIGLYDPQQDEVTFPLSYDEEQPFHIDTRRLGERTHWGASEYVVKTGEELHWQTFKEGQEICFQKQIMRKVHGRNSQCCFYFPLKIDNQVIGLISIQSYISYGLQDILLDACRALGSQLSAGLKNTHLLEAEARRANEAETLRQATTALSSSLDSKLIIKIILEELHKVVPFDCASVQLLNNKSDPKKFVISSSYGFPDEKAIIGLSFLVESDNPNREVYRTQQPIIYEDAPEKFSAFQEQPHSQADIHGWLGVPMMVGNKLIGMIALDSKQRGFFTDYHKQQALSFASQAAVAVDNARHHQDIERSNRLLKTLDKYVQYIRPDQESQKLKHQTVRLATDLVGWSAGALFRYNPHLEVLDVDSVYLLPEELLGQQIPDNQGLIGLAATTGEMQHATSVDQIMELEKLLFSCRMHTVVTIPLKYAGVVEWILLIGDRAEKEITGYELEILDRFASQAAIALQTSGLFDTEMKGYRQLYILQKINEYIEGGKGLDSILHIILTGLTAEYGVGFNRAALLLVGPDGLIGKIAIGDTDPAKAQEAWDKSRRLKLNEFDRYLKALEEDKIEKTPLDLAVSCTHFDVSKHDIQRLIQAFNTNPNLEGRSEKFAYLSPFLEVFKPTSRIILAPIKSGGKVIGILVADNKFTLAPFTSGDKDALLTFANTAAVAIENRRMLTELQKSQEHLLKTQKAAGQVAQVTVLGNMEATLKTIRESAQQVFDCSMFTLYVYNNTRGKFTHCEHFGSRDRANITPTDKLTKQSVVWRILDLPAPNYYVTENTPADPMLKGNFAEQEGVRATLTVKLLYDGKPMGTMFINFRQQHHFIQEEIDTALLFGELAAIAIQNAQLFDEVNQSKEYLAFLYDAGKTITSSLSLNDRLKKIAESARLLSGKRGVMANFCNVLLDEGGVLRFVSSAPDGFIPSCNEIRLDAEKIGIIGRTFTQCQPNLVPNVADDQDYITFDKDTMSELTVPIILEGKPIGVINLESNELATFDQDDQWALEHLASLVSVAIQNSRIYEELKKTMRKVASRNAVAWMGMSSSAWRHTIDKHAVTIKDVAKLIKDDLDLPPGSKQAERLETITRLASQILEKPITPPLSNDESLEPVLVNNLIHHRVNRLWESQPFKSAKLQLDLAADNSITVWASPEWLRRAFDLVVENAAKVLLNYPTRAITISTQMYSDTKVMITVKDSGPGFPADILEKLGKEYIHKGPNEEGLGMGLLLAETIAETYGGEVKILSPGPHDTTVAFLLPVYKPSN